MFTAPIIAFLAICSGSLGSRLDASECAACNRAVKVLDDASATLDEFVKAVHSQNHASARQTLKRYVRDLERFNQVVERVSPQAPRSFTEDVLHCLDSQISILDEIADELNPSERITARHAVTLLKRALDAVSKHIADGHS